MIHTIISVKLINCPEFLLFFQTDSNTIQCLADHISTLTLLLETGLASFHKYFGIRAAIDRLSSSQ